MALDPEGPTDRRIYLVKPVPGNREIRGLTNCGFVNRDRAWRGERVSYRTVGS